MLVVLFKSLLFALSWLPHTFYFDVVAEVCESSLINMLVETETTVDNLRNIQTAVTAARYILLQGQIGVGKTLLANHVSTLMGAHGSMVHINVDDTFDSKDLLGKFTATDVPGAFEWSPGPLTTAVQDGRWVLMEDIDLASFDVFSVLLTLLETDTLFVADKNTTIKTHPNFRIIATQQVLASGDHLLARKSSSIPAVELWTTVIVKPPKIEETVVIVQAMFPRVPESILRNVVGVAKETSGRPLSLREILRWGCRVSRVVPESGTFIASTVRELILREAIDVFCARLPAGSEKEILGNRLAAACEVGLGVAETMTKLHKPSIVSQSNSFTVGRVQLSRAATEDVSRSSRVVFSETMHSMSLLEKVAAAVAHDEPVLLTGETGVGKTFLVQFLADQVRQELIVHNLNQQTDTSDFIGGWKPQDIGTLVRPLYRRFVDLFSHSFDVEKNQAFVDALRQAVEKRLWDVVLRQFQKGFHSFRAKLLKGKPEASVTNLASKWEGLMEEVDAAMVIVEQAKTTFMFKFEEGSLVRAWREGCWILLDEVNLATSEVLERVSSVIGGVDKLFITERGDTVAIPRHPNFRVFANMNPPTDVGKKDLPPALRSKFTEFFVDDPFLKNDLCTIVADYIGFLSADAKVDEIATFFLDCVANARTTLCELDGESQPPHFSLRTLTRALTYVRNATALYGFQTALWDGLMLGFATPLQRKFHPVVESLVAKNIFKGKLPPPPTLPNLSDSQRQGRHFVSYEHIWLEVGDQACVTDERFIVTPSVANHLKNLSRAVFARRPVLLEGPTSAGKSSMVQYLAQLTGHKFVRINNHESTEIQEYIGHYVSDEFGKLRFVDGILVDAVRNGHWVVLDELNLAPTEVLEALNRLLDDNCELFIADTQETVRPHPQLRIFATQNPAGIYGGRKLLSRAFRNRFLEITVDDIPVGELQEILRLRFALAPSFTEKMVEVMKALQLRRQSSHLFAGKHGYITPRDLFRWGDRKPLTYQELAEHGFLLLGERCRRDDERQVVKDVVESIMRVNIDVDEIYTPAHWPFVAEYFAKVDGGALEAFKIVWTPAMRRLFTVVGICIANQEPVLLVGETGSSKTTVCQLWSHLLNRPLHIINCHQHTEAADFLGGLRPVPPEQREDALFTWSDGPLVRCMRDGSVFVLDEISLAEDSVLERLNSVLEPSRSLTLAEKSSSETVTANPLFLILATMNPGGDFGKKELSPALRNRFTEIYVRPTTEKLEVQQIIEQKLNCRLKPYAAHMAELLCRSSQSRINGGVQHLSIRDVIGWTSFMNAADGTCDDDVAFLHGLDAVILDGCVVGAGQSEISAQVLRSDCLTLALAQVQCGADCLSRPFWELCNAVQKPEMPHDKRHLFHFDAPTTRKNLSKLMRALVMPKAVLLEGSPGVGKTSIVEALGAALQKVVVRINLSEQTDIMDLFGTFLPTASSDEASKGPSFSWCDGVLLRAVKNGHWVILDELNLANQPVLEGLNALLDHRSTVYLPELCMEVTASPGFRVFGCQNPLLEGGGRKGLPKSFLNRFTRVRVEPFTHEDLVGIMTVLCPEISSSTLEEMIRFVCELQHETMVRRTFGLRGSPWEFNLRDVLRWAKLLRRYSLHDAPEAVVETLFAQRLRTDEDRKAALKLFTTITGRAVPQRVPTSFAVRDGIVFADTVPVVTQLSDDAASQPLMLPSQSNVVKTILMCVDSNQFCLLTGPAGSGKTSCLQAAAALVKAKLVTFSMTSSCDTVDLLGGFDQVEGMQGHFEWRDSVLLEAMIAGDWVVLDNANFCTASVLDRLNPLVEPNGVLSVNEQGLVRGETRVVTPHPNFRLFATMDPKYGEISRAMRNRATEIYVTCVAIPSTEASMIAAKVVNMGTMQLETDATLQLLQRFHKGFVAKVHHAETDESGSGKIMDAIAGGSPNVHTLLKTVEMMSSLGSPENLEAAILHRYMRNRSGPWTTCRSALEEDLQKLASTTVLANPVEALLAASMPRSRDLGSALDVVRVHRSALHLHLVDASDVLDALQYFVVDQCCDHVLSKAVVEERIRVATDFLSRHNLAADTTFLRSIGCHTSDQAELLFLRALTTVGRGRDVRSILQVPPTTESSLVNSNTAQFCAAVEHVFAHGVDVNLLLVLLRYTEVALERLQDTEQALSKTNFLPMIAALLVIRTNARRSYDSTAPSVVASVEALLQSLQKHLGIKTIGSAVPPLLKHAQRSPISSREDRRIVEFASIAAEQHRLKITDERGWQWSIEPLWRWFATHSELHLVQLLVTAGATQAVHDGQILREHINKFIATFHTDIKLLSEIDVAMWQLAAQLAAPITEELQSLVPHLVCAALSRCPTSNALFPCTWRLQAIRAVNYAGSATIRDLSKAEPDSVRVAKEISAFFSSSFMCFDVLSESRSRVASDWMRVVRMCFDVDLTDQVHLARSHQQLSDGDRDTILQALQTSDTTVSQAVPSLVRVMELLAADAVFEADMLLSVIKFHLLVPLSPVDPMFKWGLKLERSSHQHVTWSAVAKRFREFDVITFRPNSPQSACAAIVAKIAEVCTLKSRKKYVQRPDPSGKVFVEFAAEADQIAATLMNESKLRTLSISSLKKARTESTDDIAASLGMWASLLQQRTQDVIRQFVGYEDYTMPLSEAGLSAAFAASAQASEIEMDRPEETSGTLFSVADTLKLMSFPTPLHIAVPHSRLEDVEHLQAHVDYLVSCLQLLADDSVLKTTPPTTLRRLFACFRSIFRAIEKLEDSEKESDAMKVLYKERVNVIEGDDEKRLRKLKELFPSYEDDFEIRDDEDVEQEASSTLYRKARHARLLFRGRNGSTILDLVRTHCETYRRLCSSEPLSDVTSTFWLSGFERRFDALSKTLEYAGSGLVRCDMQLQEQLAGGFLARSLLIKSATENLKSSVLEEKVASGFNAFMDPEPGELKQCSKTLMNILGRCQQLLAEYPDNPTLLRIFKIGGRVAQLPALTSPLMKVMTGCEILLRECYEWERNASTEVSLITHITALAAFVLRWRRLELHCWQHVFNAKRAEYTCRASAHWFQLRDMFDLVMIGQDVSADLFKFVSEFMWESKLGDFGARLALVKSYGLELLSHGSTTSLEHNVRAHANVLLQVAEYFQQFELLCQRELKAKIDPLEDDIAQFCKIMRWEDSTYYAIRATTEKSHLKIARILGELDEALCIPLLKVIQTDEQAAEEDPSMGYGASSALLSQQTAANKCTTKEKPQKKKKSKKKNVEQTEEAVSLTVLPWKSSTADACSDFYIDAAEAVVSRVADLQKPKTPQNLKTRALSDLFDSLKDAAVPHTSETRVQEWERFFADQDSYACLVAQNATPKAHSEPFAELVLRYYRFARNLQRMRESERHPHADLSGAQVKRGAGTCEALFSAAASNCSIIRTVSDSLEILSLLRTSVNWMVGGGGRSYASSAFDRIQIAAASIRLFAKQLQWLPATQATPDVEVLVQKSLLLQETCAQLAPFARRCVSLPHAAAAKAISAIQESALHIQKIGASHVLIHAAACELNQQLNHAVAACSSAARNELTAEEAPRKKTRGESAWSEAVLQSLKALEMSIEVDEFDEAPTENFFTLTTDLFSGVHRSISSALTSLVSNLTSLPDSSLTAHERLTVCEQIDMLYSRLDCLAASIIRNTSSMCRLGLVLARLFAILFKKGFCKPEEEEEGDGEGEGDGQQDGTGMDDGQGEKDVTNEIDNEDQLMNMKDKEMQEEQQRQKNEDDEDNAADVETDFQAGKEERDEEDNENDDESSESDKEMGDVDEDTVKERKKSKKDNKDDVMDEDEGGDADEVPQDDLANEEKTSNPDEETGGFANKDEEIRDGDNEDDEAKDGAEKDLVAKDDAFSDEGDDRSDGDDNQGSDVESSADDENADDKNSEADDQKSQGSDNDPEEREDGDGKTDDERDAKEEDATGDGDDSADSEVNDDSAAEDEVDQNTFEGGQQDKREGHEDTKKSDEKNDKDQKKAEADDAFGAEQEDQGEEQEQDDAGRSWKKQEKNDSSNKRRDNSNQMKSQSNPYKAIKEALKRHQRSAQQLDMDKSVKLKDDPTAKDDSSEPPKDAQQNEEVDDFEFDEGGQNMGLAALDDAEPTLGKQEEDDAVEDEHEDSAEQADEHQDDSRRRRKHATEIDESSGSEKDDDKEKKSKSKSKRLKTVLRADEEEDEEKPSTEPEVSADEKLARGRRLWLEHEAQIQGMAQQLCEQLRLILAPTVADKLQGDYKTGKRINIKKIIPYIASQYKKDRIWLRRTKPNKRTYQIVVALDDSLSMQVNEAGSISLQSVALLSKAMQQLDVGEFGIISYGKAPLVVHPLAEAFSIESGPRAFSQITFEQTSTNTRAFLQYSLDYLDQERARLGGQIRSTTHQLQQIMFVVSDGQITEDRQELRRLLARAEENRQFVVLIILDIKATPGAAAPTVADAAPAPAPSAKSGKLSSAEKLRQLKAEREARMRQGASTNPQSVMDMQLVEFVGGRVVKKPYLENFPFPYYLVVKSLPTLPEVLADAMRQWFEMLNSTH